MSSIEHLFGFEPCPHLPKVDAPLRASSMKTCGKDRGTQFYELALRCAQSLWLQGLPAQSLLLINRAFGADHGSAPEMCEQNPLPYAAASWVMSNRGEDQFIGNPRRHYQHLATRMVEPRKEVRSWRAWACWAMAVRIFPDFPADEKQLKQEGIIEPDTALIFSELERLGQRGEATLWQTELDKL